jgi:metal-responsive CopG/Arc/MetJ family transcriptional regulator
MRLHISLEDSLVAQLDRRVGQRQRSAFISETLRRALDDETRWDDVEQGIAALASHEHEWDADPARWVHEQRRADARRVG